MGIMWLFILKKVYKWKMLENKELRRIFRPQGQEQREDRILKE
jgi:hypothetical protein